MTPKRRISTRSLFILLFELLSYSGEVTGFLPGKKKTVQTYVLMVNDKSILESRVVFLPYRLRFKGKRSLFMDWGCICVLTQYSVMRRYVVQKSSLVPYPTINIPSFLSHEYTLDEPLGLKRGGDTPHFNH